MASNRGWVCRACSVTLLILVWVASCPAQSQAAQGLGRLQRAGAWVGAAASYSNEHNYDFWSLNPYWGVFIYNTGPGYRSSLEFCVEGFLNRHLKEQSSAYELGLRPILRWHYGYGEAVSPFIEVSTGGVTYTNLDVSETGSHLNFTSHVGAGLDFRLSDSTQLSLAYRFRHLSNAGLSVHNHGLNHHQLLLGFSVEF